MNKLIFIIALGLALICFFKCSKVDSKENSFVEIRKTISINDPPCLQLYFYIKKYAKQYDIPLEYAFGLAYQETRYQGPFHWSYNSKQTSFAGAVGPMQVMLATARGLNKDNVSEDRLKTDIEYNVMTSMKLLRRLKNKYSDWKRVFGAYNSGSPIINDYAVKIYNKNYKWVN